MPPVEVSGLVNVREEVDVAADVAPEDVEPMPGRVVLRVVAKVPLAGR